MLQNHRFEKSTEPSQLAQKLSLPVPRILIFKGHFLSTLAEHCGTDFKCNAFAWSLARNFGFICIGEDLIQCLQPEELEAVIAHELSHIHHNHCPKKLLLGLVSYLVILEMIRNLGLTNCAIWTNQGLTLNKKIIHVETSDLVVLFLDFAILRLFSRYCEKEADLTAITILKDSQQLTNALFKIEKITQLKQRIVQDLLEEIPLTHPLTKHRAQYIAEQTSQKENVEGSIEATIIP